MGNGEQTTSNNHANSGKPKGNCWKRPGAFFRWVYRSERLPHYLTALFTALLALFAFYAWTESQRGTQALEGQLLAMQEDQRPYLVVESAPLPYFVSDRGQVMWNWKYMNHGKSMADGVKFREFIKLGDEPYQLSSILTGDGWVNIGAPVLPTAGGFHTATSRPGISKDYFDNLMKQNEMIGLLVEIEYSDRRHREIFKEGGCFELLSSGAISTPAPSECNKAH